MIRGSEELHPLFSPPEIFPAKEIVQEEIAPYNRICGFVDELPGQLFATTQIPVCLWFLARDKSGRPTAGHQPCRNRQGETLFIDARKLGVLIDRTHRELTDEKIARIAGTYHAWRGEPGTATYENVPGFCKSATLAEIASHGYVLAPGRYGGAEELAEDDEPFEEKLARLTQTLEAQFAESAKLMLELQNRDVPMPLD